LIGFPPWCREAVLARVDIRAYSHLFNLKADWKGSVSKLDENFLALIIKMLLSMMFLKYNFVSFLCFVSSNSLMWWPRYRNWSVLTSENHFKWLVAFKVLNNEACILTYDQWRQGQLSWQPHLGFFDDGIDRLFFLVVECLRLLSRYLWFIYAIR
jgi:hypothetical protein